jgi:hypothetical protein
MKIWETSPIKEMSIKQLKELYLRILHKQGGRIEKSVILPPGWPSLEELEEELYERGDEPPTYID